MIRLLFILLLSIPFVLNAQEDDYEWWNIKHNWDGVRSWSQYIPTEPGKMGPNALPVPDMQTGRIDTQLTLLAAPEVHFGQGEFTANLFTRINVPIKKTVAIQVWWVPVEYFNTDTVVRDMRAARTREAQGFAVGDVYIGTLIPLITDKRGWPDLMLSINLKTASGNRLQDARFTDSPGYFFDLSGGKNISLKNNWIVRPYASGGFYVYQTNREDYFQNDAILWGLGTSLSNLNWLFSAQLTGYVGYFNDLDRPTVVRLEAQRLFKKSALVFRLQTGNNSYPFTSVRGGLKFNL